MQTVHKDATLPDLSDLFAATHSHGFPILNDDGSLWGIITVTDFDRAVMQEMPRRTTASEIGVPRDQLITATASETVGDVLARMGTRGFGRMPVVDDKDPNRLLGIVKRHDIIRAYNIALARRAELQHRAKRMRIRNIDGTEFMEIRLEEGDRAVGHTVQEVARQLPRDCILVSIRRRGRMLIPHGDTVFQVGDGITAFVNTREAPEIRDLFCGQVLEQIGAASLPDYVD
ncbi:MAG: CBS domain-containing protein [Caldilineaceae bacterium]